MPVVIRTVGGALTDCSGIKGERTHHEKRCKNTIKLFTELPKIKWRPPSLSYVQFCIDPERGVATSTQPSPELYRLVAPRQRVTGIE